jgi:AraC-like DNA-binding protein
MRQRPVFDPRRTSAEVSTLTYAYQNAHRVPPHFHEEDQLVYAVSGVMSIETPRALWVVPPNRAVWVPGRTTHAIRMSGRVMMKTLYVRPGFARGLPRRCAVVNVSALFRELILEACRQKRLSLRRPPQARLVAVLVDQMAAARRVPLELPMPRDPRAGRIARVLLDDPTDGSTLQRLCEGGGASKRTIERVFVTGTAMTFGRWRQQLRLLHGVQLLAGGAKVSSAALDAGYSTPSAFIAMFRRVLGVTPGEFAAQEDAPGDPRSAR